MFFVARNYLRVCVMSMLALAAAAAPAIAGTAAVSQTEALARQFDAAHGKADFARAIEIGLKLVKLDPKDYAAQYKLAAVYALSGDDANALKWFKQCAESGYIDIRTAKEDADLSSIRSKKDYLDTLDVIRTNRRTAFEEFKKKAAESKPLVILPPNYDGQTPAKLLIVLHEDGGSAEEIAEVFKSTARRIGAILLAPRAVYAAKGGGYGWGMLYEGNYLVVRGREYALEKYNINRRECILAGFSKGANVAMVSAYRHPDRFRGVIAIGAAYDPVYAPPPNPFLASTPKYVLMVGADDELLEDNRKIQADYKDMEQPLNLELKIFKGLGHELPKELDTELAIALEYIFSK